MRVQELAEQNKQPQHQPETETMHTRTQCDTRITKLTNNSPDVNNRQKAQLNQFRKQRDAEKVKEHNAEALVPCKDDIEEIEGVIQDADATAAAIKAATESEATTEVRQLESSRESTAANNGDSRQQQLDRINNNKPQAWSGQRQLRDCMNSFEQDALNCIRNCAGLEIVWGTQYRQRQEHG